MEQQKLVDFDLFYNQTEGEGETPSPEVEVSEADSVGITEKPDATETVEVEAEAEVEADVVGDEVAEETEGGDESDEELVYQIGDKEITLKKLEELEQGNLRQSDYTKKTQALSEERKAIDAQKAEIAEKSKEIENLIEKLSKFEEKEDIDWDYLRETDTAEYLKQKELAEGRKKAAEEAKQALETQKKAEFDKKVSIEQSKLLQLHPEWIADNKLTEAGKADFKLINDYVEAQGFSPEEYKDMTSHLVLESFLKAAKYEQLKNGKPSETKQAKRAPKPVKPSVKKAGKQSQPKTGADVFYST